MHPCRDNGQYQPADSENFRQTNAQQGVRGRANHSSAAPPTAFSLVPSTARSLFGGKKRECGVGTVGSERYHALLGKRRGNPRLNYAKGVRTLHLGLFCRSLRRGTFHRRKVPKDRWGVSMRPRPLATPQAPEGSPQSAPRCAVRSYKQNTKTREELSSRVSSIRFFGKITSY